MATGTNWTQKRKPKNPIKFKINLNDEQKDAKAIILNPNIEAAAIDEYLESPFIIVENSKSVELLK